MIAPVRLRRDPLTTPPPALHRLEWDTEPDLSEFGSLSDEEKVRVIIRVLCGLVALEERPAASHGTRRHRPRPARPAAGHDPEAQTAPPAVESRRRRLPFLGYEKPFPAPVVALDDDEPAILLTWPMSEGPRLPVAVDA